MHCLSTKTPNTRDTPDSETTKESEIYDNSNIKFTVRQEGDFSVGSSKL